MDVNLNVVANHLIKMNKLNIGCGLNTFPDYINTDKTYLEGVDVAWDLNEKSTFKDNSFEEIICFNILEHVDDVIKVMLELHRISKSGCLIKISVPHFSSSGSWGDLTHKRTFSYNSFNYFDGSLCGGYKENKFFGYTYRVSFKIIKKRIIFRKGYLFLGFLFNLFPKFWEDTFLCYLFPARGVYLELEVKK